MALIDVWTKTDTGLRRESNQDAWLVDQELGLFIVADGMGGHSGGEVASRIAVETVRDVVGKLHHLRDSGRDILELAYSAASENIFNEAKKNEKLRGMGTTMVMCYLRDRNFYIANVGDSRAYLYRESKLWQMTEDHSLLNDHIRAGLVRVEDAKDFVGKNVITRSVGFDKLVQVDVIERVLQKGDRFLLCSDGLYAMVSDDDIEKTFQNEVVGQIAQKSIQQALEAGGDDNVTTMVIAVN